MEGTILASNKILIATLAGITGLGLAIVLVANAYRPLSLSPEVSSSTPSPTPTPTPIPMPTPLDESLTPTIENPDKLNTRSVVFIRRSNRAQPSQATAPAQTTPTPEPLFPAGRYRQIVFDDVATEKDITYKSTYFTKFVTNENGNLALEDNLDSPTELKLNIYQPVGDPKSKRPLIIFVYGGGWWQGDRYQRESAAIDYAKRGYVTMTMDYTMMPPGPELNPAPDPDAQIYPRIIDKSARNIYEVYSWALARKDLYRIDETRIGLGGWSAGGMISQALVHIGSFPKPVGIRAVLGLSNILPTFLENKEPLGSFRTWTSDFAPVSMFASYDDDTGFAGTANDHAADCNYLDSIGHKCFTITYPGSGHEMDFTEPPNQADAIDFFATYITGY